MPARRVLPSDMFLQRYVEQGLTHQQIADKITRETGEPVGRSAVSAALSRAGLTSRVRYDATIPWHVIMKHQTSTHLWMLRIGHALKFGTRDVSEGERRRFASWKAKLDENGMVITYLPDTPHGFYTVERKPGDEELIRPSRRRVTSEVTT